jgi:glutathione S-transferase
LNQPPAWFLHLSPTAKVPLLLVDGAVLFESSVILDFLDERFPPRYHPADILKRAQHKSWIEYGSMLLMGQHAMATATDHQAYLEQKIAFQKDIQRLLEPLQSGLFGLEGQLTLVDAAFAPLFMRLHYQASLHAEGAVELPGVLTAWGERLLALPSVQHSVVEDFPLQYRSYLQSKKSWLLARE